MANYANFPPNLRNEKAYIEGMKKQEIDRMMEFQAKTMDKNFTQHEEFKRRRLNQDLQSIPQQGSARNLPNVQQSDALDRELRNYNQNLPQGVQGGNTHAPAPDQQNGRANNIDVFHNGQRGEEWSVENLNTPKLQNLNNFYENYINEQSIRSKPFTKNDYTYFDTISNLPKGSKNIGMGGQYYLDPRKGHVII